MIWRDIVAWAIPALSFVVMSAIPVVLNLAATGWALSRVSWVAWALSGWLFMAAIGGIWGAITDREGPAREQAPRGQ
jgi:hypothetical protein